MNKKLCLKVIKLIAIGLIFIITMFICTSTISRDSMKEVSNTMSDKELELYKSMSIKLLMPSVNNAIGNYYKEYLKVSPIEAFYSIDILEAKRIENNAYLIKFKAFPYIGAHNSVGLDYLTFKITASGEVILEKFEHLESYPIPPYMKEAIIKWPPKEGIYVER